MKQVEPPVEYWELDSGSILKTHRKDKCSGEFCVIHNPSEHALRDHSLHWRSAGWLDYKPSHFERICDHGIGHPDPDGLAHYRRQAAAAEGDAREELESLASAIGTHGCDGCCFGRGTPGD